MSYLVNIYDWLHLGLLWLWFKVVWNRNSSLGTGATKLWHIIKQECIPLGCVPSAAVAVSLVDRILDNITFPQLLLRTVTIIKQLLNYIIEGKKSRHYFLEDLLTYFSYGVAEVTVTAECAHYIATVSRVWISTAVLKMWAMYFFFISVKTCKSKLVCAPLAGLRQQCYWFLSNLVVHLYLMVQF